MCFLTVNLIRVYLGGLHMKTQAGCFMLSFAVYLSAIIGGKMVNIPFAGGIIIFAVIIDMIILYAPIPSRERPVYSYRSRRKIKIRGTVGTCIVFLIAVLFQEYRNFMIWILILQVAEVIVVKFRNLIIKNEE